MSSCQLTWLVCFTSFLLFDTGRLGVICAGALGQDRNHSAKFRQNQLLVFIGLRIERNLWFLIHSDSFSLNGIVTRLRRSISMGFIWSRTSTRLIGLFIATGVLRIILCYLELWVNILFRKSHMSYIWEAIGVFSYYYFNNKSVLVDIICSSSRRGWGQEVVRNKKDIYWYQNGLLDNINRLSLSLKNENS